MFSTFGTRAQSDQDCYKNVCPLLNRKDPSLKEQGSSLTGEKSVSIGDAPEMIAQGVGPTAGLSRLEEGCDLANTDELHWLHDPKHSAASERRGNTLNRPKDFYLQANARIWS